MILTWRLNSQLRHAGLDPASSVFLDSRLRGNDELRVFNRRSNNINKKLLVFPALQGSKDEKDFSQGDALLNALLTALGSVEYPFDLSNLKLIKSEFYNQLVTLNVEAADINAANDKLFIEMVPAVQIESLNE
jgi:hypothetical protein